MMKFFLLQYSTFLVRYSIFFLDQFLQFLHNHIDLFFRIVFTEREANSNLVGIVVDGSYYVRALVGATGAGAAAAGADIIDVEIEKDHFTLLCFWKAYT